MKAGDLVMKKSYGRTWDNGNLPVRVVARLVKNYEPRLHGNPPYYVTLDGDPDKCHNPNDYFIVSPA